MGTALEHLSEGLVMITIMYVFVEKQEKYLLFS